MFLVNYNYFVHLIISLNVSQRTSGLCQTPDAENSAKIFKYFGTKLRILMFDGVLNLSAFTIRRNILLL